jgi:hypothetical protein
MSLIIKDKIQQLMIGYPTVSDKYNVSGGILAGTDNVYFGDLVKVSGTAGYFEKAVSLSSVADIAGFVLATNVKLAEGFPGTTPATKPGEAFNLMINGFMAVELDSGASIETYDAIACVAKATTDAAVVSGKTYYTRSSSAAGEGYLNDGTYAYTKVASPVDADIATYYEVTTMGRDASTDYATPNAKVYVILATGKLTTSNNASGGTVVELPNVVFTGIKEYQGSKKVAEIFIK